MLNEQEKDFILNNYLGKSTSELTKLLNGIFNKRFNENTIRNFKKKHKLKSGINTKFQKGNRPHNYKPIDTEFINGEGYMMIKIADPNTWILKHRFIYEKVYGKIPKDYSVVFADGNKTNFDIDNLILVKRKTKLVAKNKHLIFKDRNLTETGLLVAELINVIHDKKEKFKVGE